MPENPFPKPKPPAPPPVKPPLVTFICSLLVLALVVLSVIFKNQFNLLFAAAIFVAGAAQLGAAIFTEGAEGR